MSSTAGMAMSAAFCEVLSFLFGFCTVCGGQFMGFPS